MERNNNEYSCVMYLKGRKKGFRRKTLVNFSAYLGHILLILRMGIRQLHPFVSITRLISNKIY